MKKILIIVYKFPPMGGVGSRRWAKFAKYLAKKNYEVNILTAKFNYNEKVSWKKDINNKNIKIYNFVSKYPNWLLLESDIYILERLKRLINFFLSQTIFKFDIAQFDANSIINKAKKIIKENNIKNIIASGPPFSINYISTFLKIDIPEINLINDYRDNWNDLINYQFPQKSIFKNFRQKEVMVLKEFLVLFYSDKVINVSPDLTKKLMLKNLTYLNKFITITNGYDLDDYKGIYNSKNNFNLIYTGSLSNQRIDAIYLILDAIISLNDSFIYKNLKIYLYTNFSKNDVKIKYKHLLDKNLIFKKTKSPKEVIKEISKSAYCLSINSYFAPYAFGTKIFDYMALNKKILHISNGGYLSKILSKNGQFISDYDAEAMKKCLLKIKIDFMNNSIKNKKINYSNFSLETLTSKLLKLLI